MDIDIYSDYRIEISGTYYEKPFEKVMHGFDFLELLAKMLKYNTINEVFFKDNLIKLDYFDAITGESEEVLYKIQRLNNF